MRKKRRRNMRKYEKFILIQAFLLVILLGAMGLHCYIQSKMPHVIETDTIFKTDTLWRDTTIVEKHFVPTTITKIKTDTLYTSNGDTVQLETLSKTFERSVVSNEDTADVTIYTTGINTSLDSLKMRFKTHSITNTVEVTKYIEKPIGSRFHIMPQVGVGYGIFKNNIDIYVGVGLSYEL